MARASEQFRQSDVARWGIVALACGALAVVSANVSALLPQEALAALHMRRIEGPTLAQLREAVAELRTDTLALRRQSDSLATRFTRHEIDSNESVRRIAALEVSVPRLLEALPTSADIDRSLPTASIGETESEVVPVEGGGLRVEMTPLQFALPPLEQPLPPPVAELAAVEPAAEPGDYGIAIGPPVTDEQAPAAWDDLERRLGPLLLGFEPLLGQPLPGGPQRIVAGPTADMTEAAVLCGRLERVGVPCSPIAYAGRRFLP